MWIFLREGSASQNLVALAPGIIAHGPDQAAFCTDDREPDTLRTAGHINDCARLAVKAGDRRDRRDPARQHAPRPLPRLTPPREPRPGPPGRHRLLRRARQLGARRVWQAGRLVAQTERSSQVRCPPSPHRRTPPSHDHDRDTAAAEELVLDPAGNAGPGDRRREPQPDDPAAEMTDGTALS